MRGGLGMAGLLAAVMASVGLAGEAYSKRVAQDFVRRRTTSGANALRRKHGITKRAKQYAKRYGKSVEDIVQMNAKYPT